jgi:hypothetical protein
MAAPKKIARLHAAEAHAKTRAHEGDGSYQAAVADELAGTVERVLNTRYAGAGATEQTVPRPHGARQARKSKSRRAIWLVAPSGVCMCAIGLYAFLVGSSRLAHVSPIDRLLYFFN